MPVRSRGHCQRNIGLPRIGTTHETVRFWWNRLGTFFAAEIRRSRVPSNTNSAKVRCVTRLDPQPIRFATVSGQSEAHPHIASHIQGTPHRCTDRVPPALCGMIDAGVGAFRDYFRFSDSPPARRLAGRRGTSRPASSTHWQPMMQLVRSSMICEMVDLKPGGRPSVL